MELILAANHGVHPLSRLAPFTGGTPLPCAGLQRGEHGIAVLFDQSGRFGIHAAQPRAPLQLHRR